MGTRGGGDTNGIEGGITEQGIYGIDGNGPGLSCGGSGGGGIDIVDPHELHTVVCREDSCAHPADPADSEKSELEHGIPLGCVTMWRALKLTPGSTAQSSIQVKRGTGMSPPRSLRGRNDRSEKVGNRGQIFSILRCIVVLFAEKSGKYGPILPLSQ